MNNTVRILGDNLVSDKAYLETTNDYMQMDEISDMADFQDADLVYLWGDDLFILGWSLRAYDLGRIYKTIANEGNYHHWGDYLYYEDNCDYNGSTLLIIPKESNCVPKHILEQYKKIKDLDRVSIYACDYNPIDQVAGIYGENSLDYPSTNGMLTNNGSFSGNSFITDGTEGFALYGPYCESKQGKYDFTIYYDILESDQKSENSYFDIAIDAAQIEKVFLDRGNNKVTIHEIQLESGHVLEYRVFCAEGTKIKIDKVEIKAVK